jgi:hypothetical protein
MVVWNAWRRRKVGGFISAGARSVGTLDVVTILRVSTSFEPGEDWFFDYEKRGMIKGFELLPPHSHPQDQPVPGPAGRVPPNWESLLN